MRNYLYLIILLTCVFTLSACSEKEQQEASQSMSHQKELEKAKQVQPTVDNAAEKNRQEIDKDAK